MAVIPRRVPSKLSVYQVLHLATGCSSLVNDLQAPDFPFHDEAEREALWRRHSEEITTICRAPDNGDIDTPTLAADEMPRAYYDFDAPTGTSRWGLHLMSSSDSPYWPWRETKQGDGSWTAPTATR